MNNNDEPIAMVYKTYNYDQFKFLAENRIPDHIKALVMSFKSRMVPNAILCNEKKEIIDGQNRFLASKQIGAPVYYYCIEGLGIYDVASLNSYGKNWSNDDYVRMWAELGKEEYKKILDFCKEFPDLSLSNAITILSGARRRATSGHMLSDKTANKYREGNMKMSGIKDGSFVIEDIEHSRYVARCIMEYKPFSRPGTQIYVQSAFVSAMTRLLKNNSFDNAEMVRKAQMFPSLFFKCVNAKDYITMLEDLWNYKRRKQIRFQL